MLDDKTLKSLGFEYIEVDPYREKPMWIFEFLDGSDELFTIRWDPDTNECFYNHDQFSNVVRTVDTEYEMVKFIESVGFLFHSDKQK